MSLGSASVDWILVGRLLVAAACLVCIADYVRVRAKPPDWIPPRWQTIGWYGSFDRDRYLRWRGYTVVGALVFLAFLVIRPT